MSDTRFTSTKGWYLEGGCVYSPDGEAWLEADTLAAVALIEYGAHKAQAERDAALGRWRSVEHPDFVAYDHGDGRIRFLRELDGVSYSFARDSMSIRYPAECAEFFFLVVAREFFEAHPEPEPKPWLDAQPGEVWLLTVNGDDSRIVTLIGFDFRDFHGDYILLRSDSITAGRRIWPEVSA